MNQYLINARPLTTFSSIQEELAFDKHKNYLFDLSYLGVLEVTGDKGREFLQGQLTCDMAKLSDTHMLQGAQCNLKGRILSLLNIVSRNGTKIILPQDLMEPTITSLNKTALLSRVSLKANNELAVLGFYFQNNENLIPNDFLPLEPSHQAYSAEYCYYHVGCGFYILLLQQQKAAQLSHLFQEKNQLLGSLSWHTQALYRRQIDIYPESRGLFLPHRLDLHQTDYISFDKGCYKGQEIIARTHYRATLKHELQLFKIMSEERIYSGQKLLHIDNGSEIGELVDYSLLGNNEYLIAVSILKERNSRVHLEGQSEELSLIDIK